MLPYINSSKIINGANFKALLSSSDVLEFKKEIKLDNSTIDLGSCPQKLKAHYNITSNENLIILFTELKENDIINKENSLNSELKILINIFDLSGRKLDLSFCEENIKLTHNISAFQYIFRCFW